MSIDFFGIEIKIVRFCHVFYRKRVILESTFTTLQYTYYQRTNKSGIVIFYIKTNRLYTIVVPTAPKVTYLFNKVK